MFVESKRFFRADIFLTTEFLNGVGVVTFLVEFDSRCGDPVVLLCLPWRGIYLGQVLLQCRRY